MTADTPTLAEHQRKYSDAIHKALTEGDDSFQAWFNRASSVEAAVIGGYWDFSFHILTPAVAARLGSTREKTVLEIGYGGGRLVNAACSLFKEAIGIDVHGEQESVTAFLTAQGKDNFRLIRTDGDGIPLDNNSLDFIYSFIVLQHLPSYEVFAKYIRETYRCLKPGGCAQIYFGRYSTLNLVHQIMHWQQGYKETPDATVNRISLVIRPSKVEELCRATGFSIIDRGFSYKRTEAMRPARIGGQNYVTLLK